MEESDPSIGTSKCRYTYFSSYTHNRGNTRLAHTLATPRCRGGDFYLCDGHARGTERIIGTRSRYRQNLCQLPRIHPERDRSPTSCCKSRRHACKETFCPDRGCGWTMLPCEITARS